MYHINEVIILICTKYDSSNNMNKVDNSWKFLFKLFEPQTNCLILTSKTKYLAKKYTNAVNEYTHLISNEVAIEQNSFK